MKLVHYFFDEPLEWEKTYIHTLVIENPKLYRTLILEFMAQQEGFSGKFVLSDDIEILDIHKYCELITDILTLNPSENKKMISAIQKEIATIANHEMPEKLSVLYENINSLIYDIIFMSGMDISFDEINDISAILKIHNVRPDTDEFSLPEKLLSYIELCEKYLGKKLFVILNFHSYCSQEEIEIFFKDIVYRKNKILLLESHIDTISKYEKVRIIDKDMCEI